MSNTEFGGTMHEEQILSELLARVRAGDEVAATELVGQYEPELRRFVRYRLTNSRVRALIDSIDVTQSVFANLFIGLANGRLEVASPGQLVRLLTTMATNKLHDHHRRSTAAKREAFRPGDAQRELEETVTAAEPSPSEATASPTS